MTAEVLRELPARDGRAVWQARRSPDRGRLEVVCVVPASDRATIVALLTDAELRQLLLEPTGPAAPWVCVECGTPNAPGRRWCRICSAPDGGAQP